MENQLSEKYTDRIRTLSYDRITGVSRPDEDAYLDEQLESNPEAKAIWQSVYDRLNSEEFKEFFNNPDNSNPNERLRQLLYPESNRRVPKVVTVGLISVAALAVFGFFIYMLVNSSKVKTQVIDRQISLTTPDGKVIPISGTSVFKAAGATVRTEDSAMTFSGAAESAAGAMNILTVPAGLDYKITLSDGTLVWLNSETRLEFPFKFAGSREIKITGEAYLEVAPNASTPFILRLPGGRSVQVLGTTFNINAYGAESARISLVSGSVRVNSNRASLDLKPGYEAISEGDGIRQNKFDPTDVLAWREGKFYFDSMPLSDVVKVLSRWYGIQVVIDDPSINTKLFSGSLERSNPIEEFLNNASDIIKISYYKKDGVLHIK